MASDSQGVSGNGLPKSRRLVRRADFKEILETAPSKADRNFVLWWRPAPAGVSNARLGIIVSKKTGGAVQRNRVKRYIREVFRLYRLSGAFDLIMYPRAGAHLHDFKSTQTAILEIWRKAGIYGGQK